MLCGTFFPILFIIFMQFIQLPACEKINTLNYILCIDYIGISVKMNKKSRFPNLCGKRYKTVFIEPVNFSNSGAVPVSGRRGG